MAMESSNLKKNDLDNSKQANRSTCAQSLKKHKKSVAELIQIFWSAPAEAFFGQEYIAPIRGVSVSTLENERWRGFGISYRKVAGRVLYRKADVISFLESHELVNSTSQYKSKRMPGHVK